MSKLTREKAKKIRLTTKEKRAILRELKKEISKSKI